MNRQQLSKLKEAFKQRLKERNKSAFRNNNNKTCLLLHIKKDLNSYKSEKEYKKLMKNYSELKHKMYLKEKEEEKELQQKEEQKEIGYYFKKFNNKMNQFKRNIHKTRFTNLNQQYKKGIVTRSKNAYNKKVNSVIYKVSCRFYDGFKGKKDYKQFMIDGNCSTEKSNSFINNDTKLKKSNSNNNITNNLTKYRNSLAKTQKKRKRLQSVKTVRSNNLSETMASTNINVNLNSSTTVIFNTRIKNENFEKRNYKNLDDKNKYNLIKNKNRKKMSIHSSLSKISNNIKNNNNYTKNSPKKKIKHHTIKNYSPFSVNIKDIVNQYNKIKKNTKKTKDKFLDYKICNKDRIDSLIETKEDLLMFLLKRKFLEKYIPPKKIKKREEKTKECFINKMRNCLEFMDSHFDPKTFINNI